MSSGLFKTATEKLFSYKSYIIAVLDNPEFIFFAHS